jgi:DNA replication protein DnaC
MRKNNHHYSDFIRNMDFNESVFHYDKINSFFSKKKENSKEYVDDLLITIDKGYKYDYFNKVSFKIIHSNSYIDPNRNTNNIISKLSSKPLNKKYKCCGIIKKPYTVSEIIGENADTKTNYKTNYKCNRYVKNININIPNISKTKVFIEDVQINTLNDIISLIDKYPLDETTEYNINMISLHKIKTSLLDLNNMIGMKDLKNNVVDQILYYIQDLNKSGDFLHTVIYGPPGTGKTEIAKIIGQIFSKLGILKKGTFRKVTRSDLIAGYLGQTAIKTNDVINDCLGGVLFIDEAYSLGNNEKKDTFSKECIDTLCEALSNHKDNFMVIIAGYESELKECFFNYNQGLDSRFTWRFKTDEYKGEELYNIFIKKVKEIGWEIAEAEETKINKDWFDKHIEYFKFFGRDIETLLAKTKIAHARRVFCKPQNEKMKLTLKDLENGFELYLKNDEVKNRKETDKFKNILGSMYV